MKAVGKFKNLIDFSKIILIKIFIILLFDKT